MAKHATMDLVKKIVREKQYQEFVWPDERWDANGWHTPMPDGTWIPCEPLMIDMQTASAMCLLHDALNEKNQAKFEEWVAKDRAHFGRIVELSWKACSFK